jgi:hypothetical protein
MIRQILNGLLYIAFRTERGKLFYILVACGILSLTSESGYMTDGLTAILYFVTAAGLVVNNFNTPPFGIWLLMSSIFPFTMAAICILRPGDDFFYNVIAALFIIGGTLTAYLYVKFARIRRRVFRDIIQIERITDEQPEQR